MLKLLVAHFVQLDVHVDYLKAAIVQFVQLSLVGLGKKAFAKYGSQLSNVVEYFLFVKVKQLPVGKRDLTKRIANVVVGGLVHKSSHLRKSLLPLLGQLAVGVDVGKQIPGGLFVIDIVLVVFQCQVGIVPIQHRYGLEVFIINRLVELF